MSGFEWQTEEEGNWDGQPVLADTPSPRPPRRWRLILFAVALLAASGFLLYREADRRLQAVSDELEEEVLASQRLLQQAARTGDEELFLSFLSGRNPLWTRTQSVLLQHDLFFNRANFGLRRLPSQSSTVTRVDLSPDLREAHVVAEERYAVDVGNGLTESVRLLQSSLFRPGERHWLFSPPLDPAEYWGSFDESVGAYVTVAYPERDEEIALRLAGDLDRHLGALWTILPQGLRMGHVHVSLETDPQSLLQAAEPALSPSQGWRFTLPTPTLVGIPADDSAYHALFRGYAVQVVARAISTAAGYGCCAHADFYKAVVDWYLNRLGLRPWPVTVADFRQLEEPVPPLAVLENISAGSGTGRALEPRQRLALYAFVEFLMQHSAAMDATILRQPQLTPANLQAWLPGWPRADLERAWRDFVQERAFFAAFEA